MLAARIGRPLDNPLARYLAGARGLDALGERLSLDEVRTAWRAIGTNL
jgi:hypothetical protein